MQPTTDPGSRWPISRCGSAACRAPIIWARTDAGARTPVDAEPRDDGRWLLADAVGSDVPAARYVKADERDRHPGRLHTSHWATCTNAAEHRSLR